MSSTRKQADRMIGKAHYDSQRIMQSSEKEAQQIHTRVRAISIEITQTRKKSWASMRICTAGSTN
ncbi:hypothetical protein [Enterococcus viikkiensis]|uniref:hypothetical protein n=1 Tax=Enterococcus viikkiensis TaxID=930854 RepID=UPI001476B260|nr:hypothetical protein [Enterococcus viikkiensis]